MILCLHYHHYVYGSGPKLPFVAVAPATKRLSQSCRGPSLTNLCRRVLQSSIGLLRGGFVAKHPDSATSLVAKRLPGPVANPMILGRSHINKNMYGVCSGFWVVSPYSYLWTSNSSPLALPRLGPRRGSHLQPQCCIFLRGAEDLVIGYT